LANRFDTFKGPANDPAKQPMALNNEENPILSPGELMAQNVDESYCSTNNAQIEPPDNPAVDSQTDVHNPSWIDYPARNGWRRNISSWRDRFRGKISAAKKKTRV
jgi:hypothetical protein